MRRPIRIHLLLVIAIASTCERPAGGAPLTAPAPQPLDSLQCSVYERGSRTNFDPASFSAWRAADCQLRADTFVRDVRDVYIRRPASCGGENCGSPDYTGFYWMPLNVQEPDAFVLLNAGYGRDSKHVYSQRGPQRLLSAADAATFQVLWCGKASDDPDGEFVGRDFARYYLDGVPVDPARIEERWARRRPGTRG